MPLAANVYLDACLAPFREWLADPAVTEILVNRTGEVWIEHAEWPQMRRVAAPAITDALMARLAEQVARATHQAVNRENPLLAATLPAALAAGTARIQLCGPPATRGGWAMAIRRQRLIDLPLDAYDHGPLGEARADDLPDPALAPIAALRAAIAARRTILVSGGTSSGKTTFLNAMLREIPAHERIVLVEDTPELVLPQHDRQPGNHVGLIAVRGDQGETRVTTDDLVQAALRLRPDRVVVGELRGREAVSFLRAINTGHPGSFSTIHANSPAGALEQLALMVMQAGLGLSRRETLAYAASVIDLVVQLERRGGVRRIAAIAATRALIAAEFD